MPISEEDRQELLTLFRAQRDEFTQIVSDLMEKTNKDLVDRMKVLYGIYEDLKNEYIRLGELVNDAHLRVGALARIPQIR